MTSQVYYRKWRPQRLADLVGQEPVARTLRQALVQKRLAHAYLLCGPRGTGKTSTARILAMAINCLNPQEDGEPDNACHLCTAIAEGRSLDLIEIDAASNRGIDEIRSLREKVRYAPSESAYKVYVLDEAHMLTDAAADALLKTLEEPPPHVIFILATTDPQRLPATITSRCQRFDFRRISPTAMAERLHQIAAAEGITVEPEALRALTRSATGSLRDAENLLEQAVTSFGDSISHEQVRQLLGIAADDRARTLAGHLLRRETAPALSLINSIAAEGLDLRQFHRLVVEELRELLHLKSGAQGMVDQPKEVLQEQTALIQDVPLERLLYTLRLLGQVSFRHDTPGALPLELAVVECALDQPPQAKAPPIAAESRPSIPAPTPATPPAAPPQRAADTASRPAAPAQPPPSEAPSPKATPAAQKPPSPPVPPPPPAETAAPVPSGTATPAPPRQRDEQWEELIRTLSRSKGRRFNLGALLRACRQHRLEDDTLTLEFTHRSNMERMQEEMDYPESRRTFMDAVASALGTTSSLNLAFTADNGHPDAPSAQASPLVMAAVNMGGKILDTTHDKDDRDETPPQEERDDE
ncbi:MAG: DNA polymerase III subunit gamma/tau [Chloroflexi bacterium]|nr:DNA polymerase III subunit gamma/tau [Chloroflexota bacterium]